MKRSFLTLLGLFLGLSTALHAAELTVISGGAIEPGLRAAVAAYEKATGQMVRITFNTTPQMRKRVAAGDTFDVIIAPPGAIKDFAAAGKVVPARRCRRLPRLMTSRRRYSRPSPSCSTRRPPASISRIC